MISDGERKLFYDIREFTFDGYNFRDAINYLKTIVFIYFIIIYRNYFFSIKFKLNWIEKTIAWKKLLI